jgi:hypothetical protein
MALGSPRLAHCLPSALRAAWTRDAALPGMRVPDAGAQLAAALAAPAELEALFRLAARPSCACLAAASPEVLLGALEGPGGAHHAAVDWAVDAGGFCACLEALGALQVSCAPLGEVTRWGLRTQPLSALGAADAASLPSRSEGRDAGGRRRSDPAGRSRLRAQERARYAGTRQGSAPVTDIALALGGLRGAAAERLLLARAEADAIFARGSPDAPVPVDCEQRHEDGEEVDFSGFVQRLRAASEVLRMRRQAARAGVEAQRRGTRRNRRLPMRQLLELRGRAPPPGRRRQSWAAEAGHDEGAASPWRRARQPAAHPGGRKLAAQLLRRCLQRLDSEVAGKAPPRPDAAGVQRTVWWLTDWRLTLHH